MTIYTATVTIEAEGPSEAWNTLSRIPDSFAPGTDWTGFVTFQIAGGGRGIVQTIIPKNPIITDPINGYPDLEV